MSTQEERVQEDVNWRDALSQEFDKLEAGDGESVQVEEEETVEEVEATEETEVEDATEEIEASAEEIEEEEVTDPLEHLSDDQKTAFQYMPKEMRDLVENLDKELQNEIINHHIKSERAYREKTLGFNDEVKLAKEIRDLLTPNALSGRTEQQYIGQLVQFDTALRSHPAEAFNQLAQIYGYDLANHGKEQGFTDPLQAKVQELENVLKGQAQNAQQLQLQQAQKMIDDFAADKPDFKAIEPLVTAKVQQGLDLQSAYDAVKGELNLQAPQKETSQQRVPIKQKKKAASGVKSTNSTVQRSEPQSIRDELAAGLDKLGLYN